MDGSENITRFNAYDECVSRFGNIYIYISAMMIFLFYVRNCNLQ